MQTRDEASKQLQESKKTGEAQWAAAQKQYQKATPSNQKASKKTWDLAQKARDEVSRALSLFLLATKLWSCDCLFAGSSAASNHMFLKCTLHVTVHVTLYIHSLLW